MDFPHLKTTNCFLNILSFFRLEVFRLRRDPASMVTFLISLTFDHNLQAERDVTTTTCLNNQFCIVMADIKLNSAFDIHNNTVWLVLLSMAEQ
jgi:hypothetical protein